MRNSELKSWLGRQTCQYCATRIDESKIALSRTSGGRYRCLPPAPECWKFNCPTCERQIVACTRLKKTWIQGTGTIARMVNPISVNETIDRLVELNKQNVSVFGILSLESEGQCITHVPNSECRSNDVGKYESSIWVNFNLDAIGQREQWLDQFDGRHVRLDGILNGPRAGYDGCGHFSMWPAEMTVALIEKHSIG